MKRTNQSAVILALAALTLILTCCSIVLKENGDVGTVSITIGSSNARTATVPPPWLEALGVPELEALEHTVQVFDANGVEQFLAKNLQYGDTRSFSVDPGFYTFQAKAFYPDPENDELVAVAIGSAERTIHSGANPAVIIQMGALPTGTAGITLSVEQITDVEISIDEITISRTGTGYLVSQVVSVNAADYDAGSITWEIAGVGIYADETLTYTTAAVTLNADEVKYNSLGVHALTLTVTKGGTQYQRVIPFTVVE